MMISVDTNKLHFLEKWSDVYPKKSIPNTVPAKVIEETLAWAELLAYASG
jgi:hypothetical protein